jgi:hypothetical protein
MEKEKLTVETGKRGTATYRNASGRLHNPNGPAMVGEDGHKEYWINNKLHNPNGPAIVYADDHKEYWVNGKLHNPNGPAIVYADGHKEYWINNERLTEAEFKTWQAKQSAK